MARGTRVSARGAKRLLRVLFELVQLRDHLLERVVEGMLLPGPLERVSERDDLGADVLVPGSQLLQLVRDGADKAVCLYHLRGARLSGRQALGEHLVHEAVAFPKNRLERAPG